MPKQVVRHVVLEQLVEIEMLPVPARDVPRRRLRIRRPELIDAKEHQAPPDTRPRRLPHFEVHVARPRRDRLLEELVKVRLRDEGRRRARHAIVGHCPPTLPETPRPRGTRRFQPPLFPPLGAPVPRLAPLRSRELEVPAPHGAPGTRARPHERNTSNKLRPGSSVGRAED